MIRIKGQISWVRVSRSGRKKGVLAKDFISVVSGVLVVLTVVLWSLSSYTNWILHRKYDPEKDVLLKAWLPPWKHFYNLFPYVLSDNSAAIVNVLFASEPLESSALQTVRISVEANGLERLNSEILQYGMGFLEKKPLIKGAYYLPNG